MLDDGPLRAGGVLARRGHRSPLRALLGIGQAGLVAGIAQHRRAQADANAHLVHHVEHAAQALTGLADQVADRPGPTARCPAALAEVQQAVRRAPMAKLVVEAGQRDVVALAAQCAVWRHHPLGDDEQRNAPRAGDELAVRAGDLGQHQVDDVLAQLVLAARDPHLVAAQPVARSQRVTRVFQLRAGGHVGQRGAGLRLGQAHGAKPLAREQPACEDFALALAAMGLQQVGIAGRQHRVGADMDVGRTDEGIGRRLDHAGQLHATEFVVLGRRQHAGLDMGIHCLQRRRRQVHALAIEPRLLGVELPVAGRELLARDALAGVEDGGEGLARVVGKALARREIGRSQPVVKQEFQGVAHGATRLS
mmetsp:Transcript_61335/g.145005  ORF Transcript_61335/g.145005 Transcript_61335/m.145005 type:complete len:364 (-) Transcript_61335:757-1848(-)